MFPGKYFYFGLFFLALLDLVLVYGQGHRIELHTFAKFGAISLMLFVLACGIRFVLNAKTDGEYTHDSPFLSEWRQRILVFAEGMFFISVSWIFLRLLNHISMATSLPYTDEFLIKLDSVLGIDWLAYFKFVAGSPFLIWLFEVVYTGLTVLSMAGFLGLVFLNRIKQAYFYVLAFVITALVCNTIGLFFPANGTVHELLDDKALLNRFPFPPGSYFIDLIYQLKTSETYEFNVGALPGLTTFPSFHAAAGIVLAYSYRGFWVFWPVALYVVVMLAATPIYGGHYFIDLVAGIAVALLICRLIEANPSLKGIFEKNINSHAQPIAAGSRAQI